MIVTNVTRRQPPGQDEEVYDLQVHDPDSETTEVYVLDRQGAEVLRSQLGRELSVA